MYSPSYVHLTREMHDDALPDSALDCSVIDSAEFQNRNAIHCTYSHFTGRDTG